jgi:hypothetical protein
MLIDKVCEATCKLCFEVSMLPSGWARSFDLSFHQLTPICAGHFEKLFPGDVPGDR